MQLNWRMYKTNYTVAKILIEVSRETTKLKIYESSVENSKAGSDGCELSEFARSGEKFETLDSMLKSVKI